MEHHEGENQKESALLTDLTAKPPFRKIVLLDPPVEERKINYLVSRKPLPGEDGARAPEGGT